MGTEATVEQKGSTIRIAGSVDAYNAMDIAADLKERLPGGDDAVLDLRALEFMDSAGLAVLVNFAEGIDGSVTLVTAPGSSVHRLINLVGLPYRHETSG